jgi:putative ABC transport system permease protein
MLFGELAYAARTLRNSPVFTVAAAVTLALGVGASTAIFSVTNAVLLRPLPYRSPDRLVVALGEMRKRNVTDWPFSNADFFDVQNGTRNVFEDLAGVNTGRGPLPREDGTLEEVRFAGVTPNFFRMLGGRIALGRDFTAADGQPQPAQPQAGTVQAGVPQRLPNIAILSYEYFERRYGGNTAILGHPIAVAGGGGPVVVGVLAPGFELLLPTSANTEAKPDIWTAARLDYDNAQRNTVSLHLIGRLKDGVTLGRAQDAVESVAAELRRNYPIHNTSGFSIGVEPIRKHLVAAVQPALLALMGAVIFLLLIACANVANLMLVRMSSRERELAIRASLGGNWWRLVRQTLTESLLLAGIGTLLGLGLAALGIRELLVIAPANLPRLESVRIDPPVLLFTTIAGLAATALFGILPAVRAARPDLAHILRGSSRTAGLAGGGLPRNLVVISEIALCFVLLVGSGLMFRSFLALQHVELGYDASNLETFQLLGPRSETPEGRAARVREIRDRLSALPGVQSVMAASPFPLTGGFNPIRWGTSEALVDPSKFQAVDFQIVLPGYFEGIRTPLIAGRTFTEADNGPDRKLVVVDQILASKAFPFESAVGKRILIRIQTPEPEWVEIIGVVAHQRTTSLAEPGREEIFFTDGFLGHGIVSRWAVRTAGNPASYAEGIRKEIAKIGSKILITRMQPMQAWVEQARAGTRFSLLLIGAFAAIAAILAGVGLYGVLSSAVRQRTAEIGVRMALGAAPARIFGFFVGSGLVLSAVGIAIGIVAALGLTHLMTSMLVGVRPSDPITFVLMILLFLAIAAAASWLPARRASALDPAAALRED